MFDDTRVNDEPLDTSDIRQIENADEVAHLFAKLRYDVDVRRVIPLDGTVYANTQDLKMQIYLHELIATDPVDEDIRIYLFVVRSVTAKLRNDLARNFLKTNDEKVLLVLTSDYENIEFVYLERSNLQRASRKGLSLKVTIRPIPLTVNRRNPDTMALRVLKRFTFTEEDADYQWEKLRSAYMLAEWSEEYFNNRALFSDYYLKSRFTDPKITPEWNEDVRPIGREIYKRIVSARKDYTRQTEQVIRSGLFEPTFQLLGFDFEEQKSGTSSSETPDYLLYAPGDQTKPIAAALTYVWNRNLDDVDESRELSEDQGGTPFEIPGAIVVSLLEAQVAPWVIVTNGKLWRLYSSTASNKATNYYEVDLEEAIAANDQITALKYWWLMFCREAFTGFLDDLLRNSADFAKKLGDRLKDRVFVEIFPQFAKGFIADMRSQGIPEAEIDLGQVFSGTMTFLYRLMFTLYAESLELVPINEMQGYRQRSLYQIKREIAEAAGDILDESADKLKAAYKANSATLYSRLTELFSVIDTGSDELNMPTYNGGLFSQETDSGKFLARYAIPDRYLALGLDRLTRDIDDKTQALVFIDYKSLGVRHLGSIYEGLLEFQLKIAAEPLAVTKEKGKEVYQPAKKVKKPLATIAKGDVYLENDKRERKATGSYYTPDYIVKYIVRHTVGPVLDRKFKALEQRLHDAQRNYRQAKELAEKKGENPEKFWALHDPRSPMTQLVDDCLNVRVLDPAMGSGHFLVEVVDTTSNRLIDFLNAWSENPVWAFLDQTRQDILDDMERQHVSIDPDRLTRVALLKRAVLKRCVYGVDLNLMAVELAKVSLWLDAFTLGAPLSFLDHHLKHGNSLIGARVAEVQQGLEGAGQLSMFSGSRFAGVMLATDLMRQVSYLSDNTVEQTRRSAQAYRDARDHLAPYKRVLDVYTSRWFGNAPSKGKRAESDFDYALEFLKRADTQAWLNDPHNPNNQLPADDYINAAAVAQTALQAAEEKRFFHWELEFPEVFFAPRTPGGQDVQLKEDGGFDAVVGNPPWISLTGRFRSGDFDDLEIQFYIDYYHGNSYMPNLYEYFVHQAIDKVRPQGYSSMIVPDRLGFNGQFIVLRKKILTNTHLQSLLYKAPFEGVIVDTVIFVIKKVKPSNHATVEVNLFGYDPLQRLQSKFSDSNEYIFDYFKTRTDMIITDMIDDLGAVKLLGEVVETTSGFGGKSSSISDKRVNPRQIEIIKGDSIGRFDLRNTYWFEFTRENITGRTTDQRKLSYVPKVLVRKTGAEIVASFDDTGVFPEQSLYFLFDYHFAVEPRYILALLNSTLLNFYYNRKLLTNAESIAQVKKVDLDRLPILCVQFTTSQNEREQLTQQLIEAYELGAHAGVLEHAQAALDADQTDVVHDALAHLAQRMIDLNKDKQAEVKRFLSWLEDQLDILPKDGKTGLDVFTGKTVIQNYLGDYQRGEGELPFSATGNPDSLEYRLYQNRNRYRAKLGDIRGVIEAEYETSLDTLLPIKRDLARTDALIDKIVYRLYGLTDEEIELIERPQYEQALADAKAQVVADEKIDDEEKIEKIAEGILPAAKRYFERVEPRDVETALDAELPGWRALPPDAPVFLLTGDYNLRSLPEHMDFSSSVIPYTKAVEVVLHQRIFEPFRQRHTAADCQNNFLRDFVEGKRQLTLGSYMIILNSSKEVALRNFMARSLPDANRLITLLDDEAMREVRNKAAHDEVLSRDEARQARTWAIGVLEVV